MFFSPWCEREVFLFECQRLIRDDFWVSFFYIFFLGRGYQTWQVKGSRVDPDEILCFISLSSSPYLTLRGFFVSFFGSVSVEIVWDPEEMFDVITRKIFESSVCVRCQQIANRAKAWEELRADRAWSAWWEIQSRRWTFDIGRNIFMDWWHLTRRCALCPADQCCTSIILFLMNFEFLLSQELQLINKKTVKIHFDERGQVMTRLRFAAFTSERAATNCSVAIKLNVFSAFTSILKVVVWSLLFGDCAVAKTMPSVNRNFILSALLTE